MGILLTFKILFGVYQEKDWKNTATNLIQSKWYTQVGVRGPHV